MGIREWTESGNTKKVILAGGLAVVALATLCVGYYVWWSMQAPPMPETVDDVKALMADSRLQNLPEERRAAYAGRAFEITRSLPADERRDLFRSMGDDEFARRQMRIMMEARMVERAQAYALATPEEKLAILQNADEMMRDMRPPGPPPGERRGEGNREGGDRQGPPRGNRGDRMLQRAATGNPQHGQMMKEFFVSLRKYRESQGIDDPGPPGRRRN